MLTSGPFFEEAINICIGHCWQVWFSGLEEEHGNKNNHNPDQMWFRYHSHDLKHTISEKINTFQLGNILKLKHMGIGFIRGTIRLEHPW